MKVDLPKTESPSINFYFGCDLCILPDTNLVFIILLFIHFVIYFVFLIVSICWPHGVHSPRVPQLASKLILLRPSNRFLCTT